MGDTVGGRSLQLPRVRGPLDLPKQVVACCGEFWGTKETAVSNGLESEGCLSISRGERPLYMGKYSGVCIVASFLLLNHVDF